MVTMSGHWLGFVFSAFLLGCAGNKALISSPFQSYLPHRLAILPFESSNPYIPGNSLGDCFTVEILQTVQGVDMIERKDLMKILQEQKLTLTGIIRPEKFLKLGSILGVDSIIVGSVQTLETIQSVSGAISVMIKVVDVSTGKIVWADKQRISHATWSVREVPEVADVIMEKAAKKMVRRMAESLAVRPLPSLGLLENTDTVRHNKLSSMNR